MHDRNTICRHRKRLHSGRIDYEASLTSRGAVVLAEAKDSGKPGSKTGLITDRVIDVVSDHPEYFSDLDDPEVAEQMYVTSTSIFIELIRQNWECGLEAGEWRLDDPKTGISHRASILMSEGVEYVVDWGLNRFVGSGLIEQALPVPVLIPVNQYEKAMKALLERAGNLR